MRTVVKFFIPVLILLSSLSFSSSNEYSESDAKAAFKQLDNMVRSITSMEFTLVNSERIKNRMMKGKQRVSLTTQPFRCHITMIEPGNGEELIYAGAKYDYQAIYEPKGFPYMQLELDPHGSLMRKNNHHTIFDLGYTKMMSVLNYHMKNSPYIIDLSQMTLNAKEVQKMTITFSDFKYVSIRIDRKERLSELAERLTLNDYMLYELNNIDISSELKVGSTLIVPTAYAKKVELYIDLTTGLPMTQIVYDDKGVYEKYEFSDLRINFPISEKRFNSEMLGKSL
jgi:outer membrane lipoprotein-sorting protein